MCDTMPLLPEEILFDEILARLPVKSLLRFKCVSKPWSSLIESDRFARIHYRNSAKNPRVIAMNPEINHYRSSAINPRVLAVNLRTYGISGGFSLQSLLDSKEGSVLPTEIEPKVGARLLGCCNGVVCCYGDCRFWLWNPATRVSVKLPDIVSYGVLKWGFGWDESNSAYKVFVVLLMNERSGWVYSSNTNSWTKSPAGSGSVLCHTALFLRGNLHWADRCLPQVECFDLGREEFGRIELPVISSNNTIDLGVIGGNLSILIILEKVFDVWVMKEYGVKDPWLKILTFSTTTTPLSTYSPYLLFGEGPNGEIFVRYGNNLTVYSPKDDAFSTVTTKDRFFLPRIYVESLVSPKGILDNTNTTS